MECCKHVEQKLSSEANNRGGKAGGMYSCPMHPEVVRERPGMCPECGMDLVVSQMRAGKRADARATGKHAGHSTAMFLRKFWVSLILTVPVVLFSDLFQMAFGRPFPISFGLFGYPVGIILPFVFGSLVFFYGGATFIASASREIRGRMPGMMTLIALAISAAYFYSASETVLEFIRPSAEGRPTLFWELTTLITIMLLGHWIEMKAVQGAQGALKELSRLLPDVAERILEKGVRDTETVALSELKEGDIVVIRPGGKVPADGVVVSGRSDVNEAMISGESKPVLKTVDSEVVAGTINGDGLLTVRVTKIGERTFLAGIMRLVEDAQSSKSRLQLLADRAAFYLTGVAVAVGFAAFGGWLFAGAGFAVAVERLVAVLVIACPHALGLAIPLVASISTTLAARHGFLVRERLALEAARNVDVVLFDKTGTLTSGEYEVEDVIRGSEKIEIGEDEILKLAAAVDVHSEHFISRAIVSEAKKRDLAFSPAEDFLRLPGKGVRGKMDNVDIFVGGEAILSEASASVPENLRVALMAASKAVRTIIYVCRREDVLGAITLGDKVREESKSAVVALQSMGIRVAMVTGDSEEVAAWVASELGIKEYFSRVLPGDKAAKVKVFQGRGERVAMVGDGINDAPALTQADVGIAVGAGTNVAIESAGIVLMRNDPRDIAHIISLSRATYRKMTQNLFWATGYNVIAMPLAAGVLASQGIVLQPALAALLMSLSTVIVAFNALLLRKYQGRFK